MTFPYIPGHEIAGRVARLGSGVPTGHLSEGDMVVVMPSWGDGTCRQCREGNEQLCSGNGRWLGFGPPGGFAEYLAVESRHAIPVSGAGVETPEILAPMTDAGVTPYRGMKNSGTRASSGQAARSPSTASAAWAPMRSSTPGCSRMDRR